MGLREDCLNSVAVVLPSLDPNGKFAEVVDGLLTAGFKNIVIVDDGSSEENRHWFDDAQKHPQCTVIHHGVNKGKGRALKTAFEYVLKNLPDCIGAVTIDGDGQHLTRDIIACGEKMIELGDKVILGSRDFDRPGVPPRSVAGNKTTSMMFRIAFGIKINDTQTGLRAIPMSLLERIMSVEGERFEYETNMLLCMKSWGIEWFEQKIETVYDEENYSSHYNAVKDSWRIFKVMFRFLRNDAPFRFAVSGIISWLIDNGLYLGLRLLNGSRNFAIIAQIIARVVSSQQNFLMNNYYAFRGTEKFWPSMLKYYCLCIPQTLVSLGCMELVVKVFGVTSPFLGTVFKIIVELFLMVISYYVQKKWVFRRKK